MGISVQNRNLGKDEVAATRAARRPSWVWNVPLPEPHLIGLAAELLLHRLHPCALPGNRRWHRTAGWPLVVAGSYLVIRSVQAAQTVDLEHPGRLVTKGPYAVSRNPMYLGWSLLHLGVSVARGSGWVVAVFPAVAAWMDHEIGLEERALGGRFGEEFSTYRGAVPRYLVKGGHDRMRRPWQRPGTAGRAS
jgi:protein-S-isoprenylcysteine O-methyltransferase Ste14